MEKFKFDRVFSPDGAVEEPRRIKRVYKAEEVEIIRSDAFAEGEQSAAAAMARATENLSNSVSEMMTSVKMELDLVRDDSTRLSAAIARRFVEQMIAQAPEMFLERCIEACLEVMHREPELVISVPSGTTNGLKDRLTQLATREGMGNVLRIEEVDALTQAECRLDWRSGGATISLADGLTQIDTIIEEYIASLNAEETINLETQIA